jgi:hypothetical protein
LLVAGVTAACQPDQATVLGPTAGLNDRLAAFAPELPNHRGSLVPATLDDQFEAIDRDIGGFGGMFYEKSGRPVLYLKPGVSMAKAVASVRGRLPAATGLSDAAIVLAANYDYSQLTAWREVINSEGVDRTGLVFDDIDERANQLSFGVESAEVAAELEKVLVDRGVPRAAMTFRVIQRPRLTTQTLVDTINPTLGGIYIRGDTLGGCTLGFNVKWNGVMHFVTASHCTSNVGPLNQTYKYLGMGVVTGVLFCQRGCDDSTSYAGFVSKLGPEVLDPPFQNTPGYWGTLCASDELCRLSDAAMVRYDYRIPSTFEIAVANSVQPPTFPSFLGRMTVAGETIGNNQMVGTLANRTGHSTGWNLGEISMTCFHVRTYARPSGKTLKLVSTSPRTTRRRTRRRSTAARRATRATG